MTMTKGELKIEMLGPLQVRVGGESVAFRTDALRALLAYLAAHQGRPQRRDTLASLLSPDRPDKEALTYLRNRLTRLRNAMGDPSAEIPYLTIDRKQIGLRRGDDVVVDVVQFEQRVAAVESHSHRQLAGCPTCLARLEAAVALVGGELLAGLNFPSETWQAWLTAQREHVQQQALEAMTLLRDAQMVRGEWAAVVDVAQRQMALEPWLESAHRSIMRAQVALGDRNAALAQFEQCERVLWDELGVEPEEETVALRQQIVEDESGVETSAEIPHNLPFFSGQFFGREAEQTLLLQRLVDPAYRLVTLVGTGGIGKTRLSIEVGRQLLHSFPDGVWFVSLEAVQGGGEQIQIAIGEALGLAQDGKQLTGEQVLALLRDKQLLLIVDNSEVALDDLAFVPNWLRRASQIAILATSREPLNVQAESVIALEGLPLTTAEAMFAERGQMARADFAISAETLPDVGHICQLVDGSPLGISLAAAWVRRRSLAQIIAGINQSLDFLTTRLRDVDPRHRSVRAMFEASWRLLTSAEQAVLSALSVFPTSFTAEAAQAVASATLFDLDTLCEKSLLQQQPESERYDMHSLLRQFVADKLAERDSAEGGVGRSFVGYFGQFAHNHAKNYALLQPEWLNLISAVRQAHALKLWPQTLDLVQTLDEPWFHQIRFAEMREGLTLALDAAAALADRQASARLLLRLGEIEVELNEYDSAEGHLADGLQQFLRLEDGLGVAESTYWQGRLALEKGQDDQVIALCSNSLKLFEEEGNVSGVAKNLNLLVLSHIRKYRDYETGHALLQRAVVLQKGLPPTATYVESLRHLARVKSIERDFDSAEMCLIDATQMTQAQNNKGEYAAVLYERLVLCKKQGQWDQALRFGYESLENFKQYGSLRWEALLKTQLGLIHQAKQELDQALPLLQDSLQLFADLEDAYEQAHAHFYLHQLYAEMGNAEQSQRAWQQANLLNRTLNDPRLTERLEATAASKE